MGLDWKKYLPWFIIIVLTLLLVTKKTEIQTITIPAKEGSFDRPNPKPVVRLDTIIRDGKTEVVEIKNPVNQDLLNRYNGLKDSIAKIDFVREVITERSYKEIFKDSTQTITVESEVIGTLVNQKVSYHIPAQQVEVKTKTQKYHLYGGFSTIIRPNPEPSINLHLTAPKTIYTLGYEPINKGINVGIAFKLF